MTLLILLAIPVVLVGIMYAVYRSRLPNWLKGMLIAVLAIFLIRVMFAIVGVFQ